MLPQPNAAAIIEPAAVPAAVTVDGLAVPDAVTGVPNGAEVSAPA